MAITSLATLKSAIQSTGQRVYADKGNVASEGVGLYHSLWKTAVGIPAPGINPPVYSADSDLMIPTSLTLGALPIRNAGSGSLRLTQANFFKVNTGTVTIYDRLWHCSQLVTNILTTQTIAGSGRPINRGNANGKGVELWLEVYTAPGANGATWTINFQDPESGGANAATYTHPTNAESVGQMMPAIMVYGSKSCQYPIDFTCNASSGTAGDIGITLLRPIVTIPLKYANDFRDLGWIVNTLHKIEPNACLAMMVRCTTTTTGIVRGEIEICEG